MYSRKNKKIRSNATALFNCEEKNIKEQKVL